MAGKDLEKEYLAFRESIIAKGGTIKNEKMLKDNFIFRKGVMTDKSIANYVDYDSASSNKPQATQTEPASGHAGNDEGDNRQRKPRDNNRNNRRNDDGRPRLSPEEFFEKFKKKLEAKGITILDEEALRTAFKERNTGYSDLAKANIIKFPDRNKEREDKPRGEDNTHEDKRTNKKDDKTTPDKTPFELYRESLQEQGYEIIDQKTLARLYVKQKGFISPEQLEPLLKKVEKSDRPINDATISNEKLPIPISKNLPIIIEGSFADKWIKPLQKWCDEDLDKNGKPKRILTALQADDNSVVIDINPSEEYAVEDTQDHGAQYSVKKAAQEGNVDVSLGSKDAGPLKYEYFRQLMIDNKANGIGRIAFKKITTDDFRDKLLAAALEFGMQLEGAPKKVDINAPHLKDIPNSVRIKLGIHNGDITPSGKPVKDVKESILKHRDEVLPITSDEETPVRKNPKPMLALPAHIAPRGKE